ncbi:exportin-T [Trichomonascus vanleenenianus]|uniref:Ran GTPase-binding protein LOS1 n=1 Tax=Trichomonascus vanleenenianus TaxID=2268995 RepID=UPI003ECAC365
MEDQLDQAVAIAWQGTADPALRQQAIDYCNEVRNSENGWQVCLSVFTGDKERLDATRHFALQVLDTALPRLGPESVQFVREHLFGYLQKIVGYTTRAPEGAHMRNKLAESLAYLFVVSYGDLWTTFFDDLFGLMAGSSSEVGNARAVDMYLRVLKSIHEEIGDNLIARSREVTERNNVLKDLIRDRDMAKLAQSWMTVLETYASVHTEPPTLGTEIVESALRVIGGWVSWIDITLIVNPTYLGLIYGLLGKPKSRLAACDTLTEIVSKKMKPSDKLELIALLNPSSLISQLPNGGNEDDAEFDERVAKLTNAVALDLVHIMDGTTSAAAGVPESPPSEIRRSEELLMDLMGVILRFLADEYDDTSMQVFPALRDYLAYVRREANAAKAKIDKSKYTKNSFGYYIDFPPDATFVPQERLALLRVILDKVIRKARYDDGEDWTGGEDESECEFLEVRKLLRLLQDQIASIDQDLYTEVMATVIQGCLDGSYGKAWRDIELGLFELSCFGESMKSGAIVVPREVETKPTRTLYELFVKMVTSDVVSAVNHPSVCLHYIELVHRHANYFTAQEPQLLNKALQVFVSPLGVHNSDQKVQFRSWYLFFRLVKTVQKLVGAIAEDIFSSIAPLLTIKAEVPLQNQNGGGGGSDSDEKVEVDQTFMNQQYLFELCGILIGNMANQERGAQFTQQFLQPIFSDIERCLQQGPVSNDSQVALQIHHDLLAIGVFARGFDEIGASFAAKTAKLAVQELKSAVQVTLVVLDRLANLDVIRTASRFTFSRLIPLLGVSILGEISELINVSLKNCRISELPEILSFLGQLMHSYRTESGLFDMFTSLLDPLVAKLMASMEQCEAEAATGSTDMTLRKNELRRSYLGFIYNILNNGMGAMFIAENNAQAFMNVMQSILLYAGDVSDPVSQKTSAATLGKMFNLWGDGVIAPDPSSPDEFVYGKGEKVNGFDDGFVFGQYSRVCWELISKPGFNPGDAQMRIVLGELAVLQKAIYDRKGQAYASYLAERYLPAIGLPQNLIQEYIEKLASLSPKDFKKFLIDFVNRLTRA